MSWEVIVGFGLGFIKALSRILDLLKAKANISTGRVIEQAEIAKQEAEINRKQTEILVQPRTKEDTAKKLDDGTF